MNIELKDFVRRALIDVATAVRDSQCALEGVALIAPSSENGFGSDVKALGATFVDNAGTHIVSTIDFDVAVTTSSGAETAGGTAAGGIIVVGALTGAGKWWRRRHESDMRKEVSRVR